MEIAIFVSKMHKRLVKVGLTQSRKLATLSSDSQEELNTVDLAYDVFHSDQTLNHLSPLVISHGMLGSKLNWSSISKAIHTKTGRRVITVDARNHGDSPHTQNMSYLSMARDLERLILKLNTGPVSLLGHSMGGRSVMMLSLLPTQIEIDKVVIVDISPLNKEFDTTSNTEWNMEHYFHCLHSVQFDQSLSISQARKSADDQLAVRISDPGLRSWLLMNMRQDPKTREIGWKINLPVIHRSFVDNIARINFPDYCKSESNLPTLFVGGAKSDYIPPTDHEEILERFPAAQFQYIPDAGHWVHSEKPAQFLDTILPFLNN